MTTYQFKSSRVVSACADANVDLTAVSAIHGQMRQRAVVSETTVNVKSRGKGTARDREVSDRELTADSVKESNVLALIELDRVMARMPAEAAFAMGDFALSENVLVDLPQLTTSN